MKLCTSRYNEPHIDRIIIEQSQNRSKHVATRRSEIREVSNGEIREVDGKVDEESSMSYEAKVAQQ